MRERNNTRIVNRRRPRDNSRRTPTLFSKALQLLPLLSAALALSTLALLAVPLPMDLFLTQAPQRTLSGKQKVEKQIPHGPLIAVIDTGIDLTNPRLRKYLWKNPGESGRDSKGHDKETNGIDDDGNGFIDDVHGWNFVTQKPNVGDTHGHGTHVSSLIIGAPKESSPFESFVQDEFQGRLMILKYYDASTISKNLPRSIEAMRYAALMNANIINFSGGGFGTNTDELEAVDLAEQKDILFVAAAGNEQINSDRVPFYPASYNRSNILSVGAHTREGQWLPASNWGENSVDIAVLGEDVVGDVLARQRGRMSGTSQATALATGIASRLWVLSQTLRTPYKMKEYMMLASTEKEQFRHRLGAHGTLNEDLALEQWTELKTSPPVSALHFMEAFSNTN